jgi:hypothetical protein
MSKGKTTEAQKSEVLQGTLDLMVLKVIDALPAAARLWHRPPDRASERAGSAIE